jgi:kynurenine 3-monooxygenase
MQTSLSPQSSLANGAGIQDVTIVGAGLAGPLLAILLARRGSAIHLYERCHDPRHTQLSDGRSINLALAERGIRALQRAEVMEQVRPLLTPMRGRMLHDLHGATTFVPYGQQEEAIYSVSRAELNRVLVARAAALPNVRISFLHRCIGADFVANEIAFYNEANASQELIAMRRVIATDGAGSALRNFASAAGIHTREEILPHAYKELTIPATADARRRMDYGALHIWPRGGFMLIALPNLDGSFTATLFLARTGEHSFAALSDARTVQEFFATHFPDALPLMPQLTQEFFAHPLGVLGTVHCDRWHVDDRLLLLGDAAHAMVPFHGQGMNCAFEDCITLDDLWMPRDFPTAIAEFERVRRPNTQAIAQMALENYLEMRDTVREPNFQLQKFVSLELERRYRDVFIPRYSMVMFHAEIPYAVALQRGRIQNSILEELTQHATELDEIDWALADHLVKARLTA